jgi:hypothetical protein
MLLCAAAPSQLHSQSPILLCSAAARGVQRHDVAAGTLTALGGPGVACRAVGGEASGAGHTCALLLEARRVSVHGADGSSHCVVGVNGVEEASVLDCRQEERHTEGRDMCGSAASS